MTDEDLQAIQERCNAATVGPWHLGMNANGEPNVFAEGGADVTPAWHNVRVASPMWRDDCIFIAHARQDVPALLAEVRRLQALVPALQSLLEFAERAEQELETWRNGADIWHTPLPQEIVNARAALARLGGVAR